MVSGATVCPFVRQTKRKSTSVEYFRTQNPILLAIQRCIGNLAGQFTIETKILFFFFFPYVCCVHVFANLGYKRSNNCGDPGKSEENPLFKG